MATKRRRHGDRISPFEQQPELAPVAPEDADAVLYGAATTTARGGIVREVHLNEIIEAPEVQVRVRGTDKDRVERYVEFLLAGGEFKDPIVLHRDGDRLIISDGYHRKDARRDAEARFVPSPELPELKPFKGEILPGGIPAAIEYAEEANLSHGLELNDEDKYNILERRYKRGHAWLHLSDRAIAARLGVAHTTVGRWRKAIKKEMTGARAPVREKKRVGADGREYDVSGIQAANQRRAEERQAAEPPARLWVTERAALIASLRAGILDRLAGGPLRSIELMASLDNPSPDLFREAREALKAEGLIIEDIAPGMRVSFRLPPAPPAELSVNGLQIADAPASDNRYQIEPEQEPSAWLEQPASKGAPPPMVTAANGAPAHSDDHDAALDAAYIAAATFEGAALRLKDAARNLFRISGIRALHALPETRLEELAGEMSDGMLLAQDLIEYYDMQLGRLREMIRTGRPYDEEGET